jgi:S-adenosylmethionine:tRNA-ribosyltransferase-isomerase (queuine synthetase)
VNEAKSSGRRVIAVGTTTVRVLESVAAQNAENSMFTRVKRTFSFIRHFVSNRGRAADELSSAPAPRC